MNPRQTNEANFCGKVPLHQTNLVQPHGVLLVLDKTDLRILQASENAEAVLGRPVREIVASTLPALLPDDNAANLQQQLAQPTDEPQLPFLFALSTGPHLGLLHLLHNVYLLELEASPRSGNNDVAAAAHGPLKHLMRVLDATASTEEMCQTVADELKRFSGFDKVMVYRFDDDWNGDVVAEAMEPGMESYRGLKFPASDVPKQARELYRKTPYRFIPNTEYEPVKLYPVLNPRTNAFTDLSNSNLRSVAGVHLEYLRNMRVQASMSTRILKDGELWGLIACHHRSPKYLPYETCAAFELISGLVTARLHTAQVQDQLTHTLRRQSGLTQLAEQLYGGADLGSVASTVNALLEADGTAIVVDRRVELAGATPSRPEVEDLVMWLGGSEGNGVYHQPRLSAVFEPAEAYAESASGVLAMALNETQTEYVLAFRSEAVRQVQWGGNPDEAVRVEADGKRYHPRASFAVWQETVRGAALPWSEAAQQTAADIRGVLKTAFGAGGQRVTKSA